MNSHEYDNGPKAEDFRKVSHRHWTVLLLAALIISIAGFGIWLAESTSGLRWLGSAASYLTAGKVSVEGLEGELSRSMRAKIVRYTGDDLLVTVRNMQLSWRPALLRSGHLEIMSLSAEAVEVISPPSTQPSSLPESLEFPSSLSVEKLDIGALRVMSERGGVPVFKALDVMAGLRSDGLTHEFLGLHASLEFGNLLASGQIEGIKPFNVQAKAELVGLEIQEASQQPATGGGKKTKAVPAGPKAPSHTTESRISAIIGGKLEQLNVRMEGSGGGLAGEGEAQLRPFDPFIVAKLMLSLAGLNPHAFSPAAPKAELTLQADLSENNTKQLEGVLNVQNANPGAVDKGLLPLLRASAQSTLSAELIQLDDLKLDLPAQGEVAGRLGWQFKQARGFADLRIKRVNPASLDTRLRTARLSGEARLSGNAESQQAILALHDQKLHMDARLAMSHETLTLEKVQLRHGRSTLAGHGKLGLGGARPYTFDGALQHFDASAFVEAPRTNLNATLKLGGELAPQKPNGQTAGASGTAHFRIGNSHIAEKPIFGNGHVEFRGAAQVKGEIELNFGANRLLARGGYGRVGDQLQLELAAPALAQIAQGYGGSLAAEATVDSSSIPFGEKQPEWPDITFRASGEGLSFPGEHHLGSFNAAGTLHGDAIALTVSAVDYIVQTEHGFNRVTLEVDGRTAGHEVRVSADVDDKQGVSLRARGGLTKPTQQWQDAEWRGELGALTGTGRIPFHLEKAAPLHVSATRLSLDSSKIVIAGGEAQIHAIEWRPEKWRTSGYFSGIGLRPGANGVKGAGARGEPHEALRLGGDWDISAGNQLRGVLNIKRESGDWILPDDPPLPLGLETLKLTANATDGRLTAELVAKGARLGEANALVSMPVMRSSDSAVHWKIPRDAALAGNIFVKMQDISWMGPALDDTNSLRTGGQLALEADVIGTLDTPRLKGRIQGDKLAVASLEQGVRLEQGRLVARFDEESLRMEVLDFIAPHQPPPQDPLLKHLNLAEGPGTLRASGVMDFKGERGSLEIDTHLVPLAQRPDRWIIASGKGSASLENNILALTGDLTANAGLLAQPTAGQPHLPDDVVVIGQDQPGNQQDVERRKLRINVEASLDLGERFYINASGLEGRLVGQLRLHGEPGERLRALGTITARDTKFEAYGQQLSVERGIVSFQGPLDDPALNVLALRKGLSVQAGVQVTGSVRHPVVQLVSTPTVPDLEKLSWITLGRAPGGKADATLLLSAASSILGGQAGGVTEKITQALGVDELSIRQAGTDPLTGQIGVIGKRLSKEAYISYEQGLTAVAGVTKLTYTVTPKITLVARAGIDNAIDLLYSLSFD